MVVLKGCVVVIIANFDRTIGWKQLRTRIGLESQHCFKQQRVSDLTHALYRSAISRSLQTGDLNLQAQQLDALSAILNPFAAAFNVIANAASEEQKRFFFGEALDGARFGNAGPERNGKNVLDVRTRASLDLAAGDGSYRLNGTRFYSTGALYAHWIPSRAVDDEGVPLFVYNRHDADGLRVIDDWSSFGQRTTASGTVVFDNVSVPAAQVLVVKDLFQRPNNIGPVSQLIQAAIDVGIAEAAVRDTIAFVTTRSRPYIDSGLERAADDPYILRDIGHLTVRLHAAEALLERAAQVLDTLPAQPDFAQMAQASVAVAEAKVLSTELSLLASEKLFELSGSAATLAAHNLDRHWRNARVHTLHDPVRWKYYAVGNYALNGTPPPRHSWS